MLQTTLAAVILTVSSALAASPAPEVLVRVSHSSWVPGPELILGQHIASRILGSAGIRLRWEYYRSAQAPAGDCEPGAMQTIDLHFSYTTPEHYKPGALASALPFGHSGVRITVFYDRMRVHPTCVSTPLVLGHTLAHEIGHVLLRNNSHTDAGLMRGIWRLEDFRSMPAGELQFTPSHVEQMRMNLAGACPGAVTAGLRPH